MGKTLSRPAALLALGLASAACFPAASPRAAGWEPSRPVRLVVLDAAAGELAGEIQEIVTRDKLLGQPIEVAPGSGGGGAEGLAAALEARGDPHVLVLGRAGPLVAPLAGGAPAWRGMTPVSMLALDRPALWVGAASPHRTVAHLVAAAYEAGLGVGGTGSKREDELVAAGMARATGALFAYLPFRHPAGAAQALAAGQVDATIHTLSDAVAGRAAGGLRPLCVFGGARPGAAARVPGSRARSDIPTCKEAGLNLEYALPRGVLLPGGVTADQRAFYEALFARLGEAPAWRDALQGASLEPAAPGGEAFSRWLAAEEGRHRDLALAAEMLPQR